MGVTGRLCLPGVVVPGHGVASGRSATTPFPAGTIDLQLPHFAARGLDLTGLHHATVNVDVAPLVVTMVAPEHTFTDVDWTDVHGPETFSFARCGLTREGARHTGWVYWPHPETKPMNEQRPTVVELLLPWVAGLGYGDEVVVDLAAHVMRASEP